MPGNDEITVYAGKNLIYSGKGDDTAGDGIGNSFVNNVITKFAGIG